jgi:pimeloyl-ACP methyl ester carboxylesterase
MIDRLDRTAGIGPAGRRVFTGGAGRVRALAAALVWLAAAQAHPAAAQWQTVDTFTIKGAHGLIVVPENWNGGLFIYAHGYSADRRLQAPIPDDVTPENFTEKLDQLLQASVLPTFSGYAIGTTTFRSAGWVVKDAIKDIENVRRRFVKKYGEPTYTYLWGHSGGGMVTSTVIEYFPDTYDGAMPMCGPGAGARRNFNGAFDLRAAYEYVCGDVPAAQFVCGICSGGKRRCLADGDCPKGQACSELEAPPPPEDGLSKQCSKFLLAHPDRFSESATSVGGSFVTTPVTACFGDLTGAVPPTPEQAARRDFFVRATQIPENFVLTDMFFASIGMSEVVHVRNKGKHPWGNEGVVYDSPTLTEQEKADVNAGIYRVREDKPAVAYMQRFYEPRGDTSAKVLTIHALDDGLVLPENETKYRQAFEAAGRADQLVQLTTEEGGHCGFIVEMLYAIPALTAWVEDGDKPTTAALIAACPGCSFTETEPGPWGLKVAERVQHGVPLDALVCTGLAGDCPLDSSCSLPDFHCVGS